MVEERQPEPQDQPDAARREAMLKMGRFAAYTAPTMLVLLGATKARAWTKGSSPPPDPK